MSKPAIRCNRIWPAVELAAYLNPRDSVLKAVEKFSMNSRPMCAKKDDPKAIEVHRDELYPAWKVVSQSVALSVIQEVNRTIETDVVRLDPPDRVDNTDNCDKSSIAL